jgi:hypothetical protein
MLPKELLVDGAECLLWLKLYQNIFILSLTIRRNKLDRLFESFTLIAMLKSRAGNPLCGGRLSTVDLLVLNQLLFLKYIFFCFY